MTRRQPDTSRAAHASHEANAGPRQREAVYDHLVVHGPRTADELNAAFEDVAGWKADAAAKALDKLKRAGRAVDTGERRLTRTGHKAAVCRAVTPDEQLTASAADLARWQAEQSRRELLERLEDTIDNVATDTLPRAIRVEDLELIITIRHDDDPHRPALPA